MIVEIKQHADSSASSVGLDKYNRSKLPGTFEIVQPGKGVDGRWITGIDEDSLVVNQINDPLAREKRKEEVKKLREDLERLTGLNLSATNGEFWKTYKIVLRDNFSLDLANAQDKLKYYVLISNEYAGPELEVMSNPDYNNTKYYISRKEEEAKGRVITRKVKDEARAKLLELSKNYDKMILIAKYLLGTRRIKQGLNEEIAYEELSKYIDDPKEKVNVSNFILALEKTVEELQHKLVLDEAQRMGVVKVREGYYQRGNATYGKSLKEAIEYLSAVENSSEFASLKEEVETS